MNNEIFNHLFNYALANDIGVTVTKKLCPSTPSFVDVKNRHVIVNSNYKNKRQLPFQLAHEIAHILNNDGEFQIIYFSIARYGIELEANKLAIKLVAPFYLAEKENDQINYVDFMQEFCIPHHLENEVKKALNGFLFRN